jgi:phage terminase small subunit
MLKLTQKQERFVAEYLIDGNGTRAAVAAGYGLSGAHASASRMLRIVKVQEALQARQAADATRLAIQREDVIRGLLEAVEEAKAAGNPAAMISGWSTIGKMLGFFSPERVQVNVAMGDSDMVRRMEAMSDTELMAIVAGT